MAVYFSREGEKTRLLGREVVKLVTPGTLVEPLDNRANYLLSIVPGTGATVGLAWLDVSTAEFSVTSTEVQDIEEDIERICPSEVCLIVVVGSCNYCTKIIARYSFCNSYYFIEILLCIICACSYNISAFQFHLAKFAIRLF